tara:strand:- start:44 stop:664 length:621 start_codon:yes stop_codon:yes gene_type:complete
MIDKSFHSNKPSYYFVKEDCLKIKVFEDFFSRFDSDNYIRQLQRNINWKKEEIMVWGKKIITKREVAWYADPGKTYSYSGTKFFPNEWTKTLLEIKNKIDDFSPVIFNSVLLNKYPDGKTGMGWHSDDEKELGTNPVIGSVSFGAERDFLFKHKKNKNINNLKIHLKNGSLLIMMGETQHYWLHSLPVRRKIKDKRINLTFRKIIF